MKQLLRMLALAASVQNRLFRKTTAFERWLLVIAGLALVYPKAMFDYIGIALIVVVIAMQKLRKEEAYAATG